MGAEGDYAQTPKASTFHVANAPKRDAEGVERLHLRICRDVLVNSGQHGSHTLMFMTRRLLTEQPSHFFASFKPAAYFNDGNLHILATYARHLDTPVRSYSDRCVGMANVPQPIFYRGVREF